MSFKLLAIRPLEECNPKFLKNLEENRIYQFYNDYEFQDEKGNVIDTFGKDNYIEVNKIKHNPTVPDNLYKIKEGLEINISAIVGKNGSGKSSLVELLYVFFYNLALNQGIINNNQVDLYKIDIKKYFKRFVEEYELENDDRIVSILNLLENLEKSEILYSENYKKKYEKAIADFDKAFNSKIFNHEFKQNEKSYKSKEGYIRSSNLGLLTKRILEYKTAIRTQAYLVENIYLEIYFIIENEVYLFSNNKDDGISFRKYKSDKLDLFLDYEKIDFVELKNKKLFYNLVINYSLYGLNSLETGDWINKIYHKNDGYQTPIVINPYRQKGNILINGENELILNRLMCNLLLNDKLKKVTPNSKIEMLIVNFEKATEQKIKLDEKFFSSVIYKKFINDLKVYFLSQFSKQQDLEQFEKLELISQFEIFRDILRYILNKLNRIVKNYFIYKDYSFFDDNENEIDFRLVGDFLTKIKEDNSHITYKIRQSVNFIFFNFIQEDFIFSEFKNNTDITDIVYIKIKLVDYEEQILKRSKTYNIDIINLLPPSIFTVDFEFDNKSKFLALSSGEKQQIFSINSILYHLINLNSTTGNDFPLKYPYINLVLDEIELYAHPEMQRKYISELLVGINKLETKNILGINILFITHSPFILSDIPKQNVLFLDSVKKVDNNGQSILDKESKEQFFSTSISYKGDNTFAENIHEMLTDGFFISSTKGAFATSQINAFLSFYKDSIKMDIDSNEYKAFDVEKLKEFKKLISLIGEDYIRKILQNHLEELYNYFKVERELTKEELEKEEKELRSRLSEIEKKLNANEKNQL
ncbi:hypothetical protein [Flavobacterium sp.]|uniref:hypothetical protein n=1 Tax=Flavobacterium sp. TaxID=239 RepID=UPI004048BED1